VTRVVRTPSALSVWSAECVHDSCEWWPAGGNATVEDAARDHVRDTGHTVAVQATLRFTFQPLGATP
jgi:hypothetical protein